MVADKLKQLSELGVQEVTLQKDIITQAGFDEMNRLLVAHGLLKIPNWFPNEWECRHDMYQGNLTTRYKKYLYFMKRKADDVVISKLGEIAKRYTSSHVHLRYDITNRFDWNPGEFGEGRDSCFWTNKRQARRILQESNAYAIRIHDGRRGRAWIIPDKPEVGCAVMFNVYWSRQPQIVGLVSDLLALSFRKWKLINNGTSEGMLHINNGWGWLLATHGQKFPKIIDLKINDHSVGVCVDCGRKLWDDLDQYDSRPDGLHCIECMSVMPV